MSHINKRLTFNSVISIRVINSPQFGLDYITDSDAAVTDSHQATVLMVSSGIIEAHH